MKNNKLLIKIYISSLIACFLILMILVVLGNVKRIGYLNEFIFDEEHINNTLELNGLSNIIKDFKLDGKLDEQSIKQFIFTNEAITNYSYGFRIKYYSKVFRNSDIYGVYIDTNKIIQDNSFIKKLKMNDNGSPFGNLISTKIINYDEKINNINYILKIKLSLILSIIVILIGLLLLLKILIIGIIAISPTIIKIIAYLNIVIKKFVYKYIKTNYKKYKIMLLYLIIIFVLNIIIFNIYYNILLIPFIIFFFLLRKYYTYKKSLSINEYYFLLKIEIIFIFTFLFQYWLFYPGYFQYYDTLSSIQAAIYNNHSLSGNNWHPIILDIYLNFFLVKLGLSMGSLFLINLLLWYLSIFIITVSIYIKYKRKIVLFLVLITFISNIFFSNIEYTKDFIATLYVLLSYSIVFCISLLSINNKLKLKLKIISLIILIIGMLHRHNFIVTIYPIFLWFTYDYLKSKNINTISKYLITFISAMILNAIILIGIYFLFPRIFLDYTDNKHSTYQVYFLQIAGCIVPANDNIIPDNWWLSKNFDDFVEEYNKNPLDSNPYRLKLYFNYNEIDKSKNIKRVWIKAILKHPLNYIKHILNFTQKTCTLKYVPPSLVKIQEYNYYVLHERVGRFLGENADFSKINNFIYNNPGIKFTFLKTNIYRKLLNRLPNINIAIFIMISIIIFFISGILWILKKEFRNDMLLFSFCMSFSALATSVIVSIFGTGVFIEHYRFIYPIIPITILSLISMSIVFFNINRKYK